MSVSSIDQEGAKLFRAGFWIRIRIGSGFNEFCGSAFGIWIPEPNPVAII
jgi:hypothetical protein